MQRKEVDVYAIGTLLSELKSKLHRKMRDGEDFENLKDLYLKIKELECCEKSHQLESKKQSGIKRQPLFIERLFTSGIYNGKKYRHIAEPPPLL